MAVNTFPGLVHTARHMLKVGPGLSECANRKEVAPYTKLNNSYKVVTRYPYWKVGVDHLLL